MNGVRNRIYAWGLGVLCLVLSGGCGGGGASDQPDLARVSGTVTLDGNPLADAMVRFYPQNGRPSSGKTDSQGRYELIYLAGTKGAVIGEHEVRISTADDDEDPLGMQNTETVPAIYNKQTKLKQVVEKKDNTIDFTLVTP